MKNYLDFLPSEYTYFDKLFGFKIYWDHNSVSECIIPPKDKFVEYEQSDNWWLKKYPPKGTKVETKPCIYKIGDSFCVHPSFKSIIYNTV